MILREVDQMSFEARGKREKDETHQMTRHIHEVEVFRADELNRRSLEESVVFLADVGRVFDRFSRNLVNIRFRTDYSDCMITNRVSS